MSKSASSMESHLSTISAKISAAVEKEVKSFLKAEQASLQMQRSELKALQELKAILDELGGVESLKQAALSSGLPFKRWVIEALAQSVSVSGDSRVGIAPELYAILNQLAYQRNISLDTLTRGKGFSDVVRHGLDNRFI